jgi:hypothetical protein
VTRLPPKILEKKLQRIAEKETSSVCNDEEDDK